MFHDHISMPEASRQHLISESRAFPNPRFDQLLEDASYEDLIWLDGALSDQLDGLPHYIPDDGQRRVVFVQISDRLAMVRRFAEMRGKRKQLVRHARLLSLLALIALAAIVIATSLTV